VLVVVVVMTGLVVVVVVVVVTGLVVVSVVTGGAHEVHLVGSQLTIAQPSKTQNDMFRLIRSTSECIYIVVMFTELKKKRLPIMCAFP
jgi:hypothetical protein